MPTGYEYWEYKNWRGIPKPPGTTEAEAKKFWAIVPKDGQATRVTSFNKQQFHDRRLEKLVGPRSSGPVGRGVASIGRVAQIVTLIMLL
jgi:hypothetical protein